jgi:molecular chaperone DnaK
MPQVEVTFDIDANGILHVSAKDKASGKEQKIRIEASSGLSDADIDKMVKQAEANAKADEARRQEIDTRNQLDGLVYKVEKDSKEWIDRLAPDVKETLDKAVEAGKEALRAGDSGKIRTALDELNVAYSAAGASLYQNASASGSEPPQGGAAGGEGGGAPKNEAADADYEIVDDAPKS